MGLIAVDVTGLGVVMSGDSQRVEIRASQRQIDSAGGRTRNPIVIRRGDGFTGLIGSVGTETIEGLDTATWLRGFSDALPDADVGPFCATLADRLTEIWQAGNVPSVLEILVTGVVSRDVQFWYVRNSQGLDNRGFHNPPTATFSFENDLDVNYVSKDAQPGEAKASLLARQMYSFWQGVIFPASVAFTGFTNTMGVIYGSQVQGFVPISSLDDVGFYARVRMEFLKRLYSPTHGIYAKGQTPPVGGVIHVYGVSLDGEVREYAKNTMNVVLAASVP